MLSELEGQRDVAWEARLSEGLLTSRVGCPILAFHEVGSTNDIAKHLAEAGGPSGLAVIARNQTAGRGRRGRHWISSPGQSVLMSVVLRTPLLPGESPWLGLAAGVAVADSLETLGLGRISIKWPNDILVNGRKIAGILVEPRLGLERLDFAVLGIGVNVRQRESDWPASLRGLATSCLQEGCDVSLERVAAVILKHLEACEDLLLRGEKRLLIERWIGWGGSEELPQLD
ncbi:MAG: biotin--[acetyl-CoA-carboxylase] ligase [Kiritimatiellae bacterium]|nr:biotin--[acetyl-CoA-carboxylase] ligase [Kiritimatiellia bacterium]MDW8459113.1 biotin--[acetyl-CoA-carboxylase] ligase [Verrucomicrobiota bacterium]